MFQAFLVVCLLRCRTRLLQAGCSLGWGVDPSKQKVHEGHHHPTFCWDFWNCCHQMQQIQRYSINVNTILPPAGICGIAVTKCSKFRDIPWMSASSCHLSGFVEGLTPHAANSGPFHESRCCEVALPVPQAFPKPAGVDHPPIGQSTPKGSWQALPLSKMRVYKQRKQTVMSVDILTA